MQNGSKKDIKGSGNAETSLTEKAASDVMRNLPKTQELKSRIFQDSHFFVSLLLKSKE